MRDDKVFEDSVKTLRATLMVEQFFCGKVTLDKAALHESVKTGDCKPAFFTAAEKCAEPFRSIYENSVKKKSQEVCSWVYDTQKYRYGYASVSFDLCSYATGYSQQVSHAV